jgi:hypothetical protein
MFQRNMLPTSSGSKILWHIYPLLDNDREISSLATAVARWKEEEVGVRWPSAWELVEWSGVE